jgi:hypothetical protein
MNGWEIDFEEMAANREVNGTERLFARHATGGLIVADSLAELTKLIEVMG